MAAYVDKRIGLVGGEPILEIRRAVVIRLDELRLAHDEIAEMPLAILAPRKQRAAVEALVVLHPYEQPPLLRHALDLDCLLVFQHKRLHARHMLVVAKRLHHHLVVKLVGHGHHDHLARLHPGQDIFIEIGMLRLSRLTESGMRG